MDKPDVLKDELERFSLEKKAEFDLIINSVYSSKEIFENIVQLNKLKEKLNNELKAIKDQLTLITDLGYILDNDKFNYNCQTYGVPRGDNKEIYLQKLSSLEKQIMIIESQLSSLIPRLSQSARFNFTKDIITGMIKNGDKDKINSFLMSEFCLQLIAFKKNDKEFSFKCTNDLQTVTLKSFTLDQQQVTNLASYNQFFTVTTLDLSDIKFTVNGFKIFLDLIINFNKSLTHLFIKNSNLTNRQILAITQNLSNSRSLICLNFEGNKLSNEGFENIVLLLPSTLKFLNLSNNLVDYKESKDTFSKLKEIFSKLSGTIEIDISGNLIESSNHNKDMIAALSLILRKYNAQVNEVLDSKFKKLKTISDDEYHLTLTINGDKQKALLNSAEILIIKNAKTLCNIFTDDAFFNKLLDMKINKHQISNELLNCKLYDKANDDKNTLNICKKLLDYRNNVPLKSYIRTHNIFRSRPIESVKSLLSPSLTVTKDNWIIHIIAKGNNSEKLLGQHAWLAYEGLKKHGQRFFRIAHLQARVEGFFDNLKHLFTGGVQPKIEFFVKGSSTLELVDYINADCIKAAFIADRKFVKKLHEQVENDIRNLPKHYKILISTSNNTTEEERKSEPINCIKWAIEKVETSLDIVIPADIKGFHIPSEIVHNLKKLGEPVDLKALHPIQNRSQLIS